ncbi:MAG TPA: ATP-binding protein, partial [Phycisphaerales bacterium]|nr:ATP-binding protein [Phycisphaerales bacterium]
CPRAPPRRIRRPAPFVPFFVLTLTVIQGPDKGRTFQLTAELPQLIGRSSEALPIGDTTVSRRHAELTPDGKQWYIRDLSSQNGTWVNGVRITGRQLLKAGDQIRTGSTLFVFGQSEDEDELDLIRVLLPDQIDATVERRMPSNDDSVILAEPEPRSAAIHHLQVIYRLTALTSAQTNRDDLLKAVMELVFNELRPERGFIVLCPSTPGPDPDTPSWTPAVVKHKTAPADKKDARIHISRTILNHALKHAEGVLSSNAMNDPRFAKGDSVQRFAIRSALCSPIEFGGKVLGAIYVDSSIANYTFTQEQLALLNAIARQTGLAMANADAYAKKVQTERLAATGETVAVLSHSIKNILQGLRGGADVVEMGLKKEDLKIARGGWAILKRNIDRIMALTLNMLAYSRPRVPEYELTRIGDLLEECASLLTDQCAARQVALIVDADPEMPPVMIDPHLLHQAIVNLLGNAVEAVEPKTGAVTVKASYIQEPTRIAGEKKPPPHTVRIDVIDNGPGISRERHAQIFEPFHTTKGIKGTGLGLTVTKRIVEEHKGRVFVESEEGRGATFTILIPAETSHGVDPSATTATRTNPSDPLRTG